jgi:hypothetical protein
LTREQIKEAIVKNNLAGYNANPETATDEALIKDYNMGNCFWGSFVELTNGSGQKVYQFKIEDWFMD